MYIQAEYYVLETENSFCDGLHITLCLVEKQAKFPLTDSLHCQLTVLIFRF